jgi:hypothetical protein
VGGNGWKFLRQEGQLKLARHLKLFFHLFILRAQFARVLLHLGVKMRIKGKKFGLSNVARSFSAIDPSADQTGNLRNNHRDQSSEDNSAKRRK